MAQNLTYPSSPQGPSLQIKGQQQQRLIMLPKMQQAIHMLQVPILELSAEINEELAANPLLELDTIEEVPNDFDSDNLTDDEDPFSTDNDLLTEVEVEIDDKNLDILCRLDEDFSSHMSTEMDFSSAHRNDEEKLKTYQNNNLSINISLNEFLIQQARETFELTQDLETAEIIIGSLDEKGFLTSPLKELCLLTNRQENEIQEIILKIQSFDPVGVCALNLQDSFLIQLSRKGLINSLAYSIIKNCYDDLLHHRITSIQRKLKCSSFEVEQEINEVISKLDLQPAGSYSVQLVQAIVPDVSIILENDHLIAKINDDSLPPLRLNGKYLRLFENPQTPQETKNFIKKKVLSAKWLLNSIQQRNSTILRLADYLAKTQKDFFIHTDGQLKPLTMKIVADELEMHESTIARTVSNKYVDTPRGLFPLRYFFTHGYASEKGVDISSTTVRNMLEEMIKKENKTMPLSDEALSDLLKKKGVPCARRTIAKYRRELNIGNAFQRKTYH